MGNYRFKLSDMIPNAWFYKLRDIGKTRTQNTTPFSKKKQSPLASTTQHSSKPKQPHQCNNPRKSYYFTRELDPTSNKIYTSPSNTPKFSPDPPRKSSKQRRTKKRTLTKTYSPKVVNSSVSSGCNCHATLESVWSTKLDSPPLEYSYSSSQFDISTDSEFPDPEFRTDRVLLPVDTTRNLSCTQGRKQENYNSNNNNNNDDIVIDVDKNSLAKRKDGYEFDSFSEVELPPIITKPVINDDVSKKETKPREQQHNMKGSMKVKIVKENTSTIKEHRNSPVRRFSMSSSKVKVHVNSPRIERRKVHSHGRKIAPSSSSRRSLSDSFAIVKSSCNPQKDFRESMVEMIVENNLKASKDLEDLLACYLSLNSDEYHDIIIKVFKQIWFDFKEKR